MLNLYLYRDKSFFTEGIHEYSLSTQPDEILSFGNNLLHLRNPAWYQPYGLISRMFSQVLFLCGFKLKWLRAVRAKCKKQGDQHPVLQRICKVA